MTRLFQSKASGTKRARVHRGGWWCKCNYPRAKQGTGPSSGGARRREKARGPRCRAEARGEARQTGLKFPRCRGHEAGPPGRRGGTRRRHSAERTAPARPRKTGAAGLTLPPPTGPRSPRRRGALAAGRAGTAAGARGPAASGRFQPWLRGARPPGLRPRGAGGALGAGKAAGGAGGAGGASGSLGPRPHRGVASAWPCGASGVRSSETMYHSPTCFSSRCPVPIFKRVKRPIGSVP